MEWQTSFALPEASRQRALRLSRLRHRRCSPPVVHVGHKKRTREAVQNSTASTGRSRRKNLVNSAASTSRTKKEANNISHAIIPHSVDSRAQVCRRNQTQTNFENVPTVATFQDGNLPALLSGDFFKCTALELAPKLLGKFLRRDDVILQITEVEAYCPNDSACHGRFGITARTAPVFGPAGHAYVYLCYGLHNMLNIVADMEGIGAAVLIRSCAPVAGLKTIQSRRGMVSIKPELLSGPGKIGQALGLTAEWSNHPLYMPGSDVSIACDYDGGLEILDGPNPENILVGPRVGIDYANSEDVAAPWRFAISGSPWISAPKNTLKPAPS